MKVYQNYCQFIFTLFKECIFLGEQCKSQPRDAGRHERLEEVQARIGPLSGFDRCEFGLNATTEPGRWRGS